MAQNQNNSVYMQAGTKADMDGAITIPPFLYRCTYSVGRNRRLRRFFNSLLSAVLH